MIIMNTVLYIAFTKDNMHFYTFTNKDNAINKCLEMGVNTNSILEYNENKVNNLLANDTIFERLNNAEYDRWDLDKRIAKNGYNRLVRNLKKIGLSLQEWDIWCTL